MDVKDDLCFDAEKGIAALAAKAFPLILWGPILAVITTSGGGIICDIMRNDDQPASMKDNFYPEISAIWGFILSLMVNFMANNANANNIFTAVVIKNLLKYISELYIAFKNNKLHRNFMGYTIGYTELMIGLGVSSISDSWTAYAQNNKVVEEYLEIVNEGRLPVIKGHILSEEDLILRRHILNLMCQFHTEWKDESLQHPALFEGVERMKSLVEDGFIKINKDSIEVRPLGRTFIRNICMTLDNRLWQKQPESELFSKAI